MTPLFEGIVDYDRILAEISGDPQAEASLEWFGNDCLETLGRDRRRVRQSIESRERPLRTAQI